MVVSVTGMDSLSDRAAKMREALQKSQTITDNVVSILGSFDSRLSALETAMRPTQVPISPLFILCKDHFLFGSHEVDCNYRNLGFLMFQGEPRRRPFKIESTFLFWFSNVKTQIFFFEAFSLVFRVCLIRTGSGHYCLAIVIFYIVSRFCCLISWNLEEN